MRILRMLFFSALVLGIIGAGGFLIVREVLLSVAVSQVKSGVSAMRLMKLMPGQPTSQCTKSTLPDVPYGTLQSLQLVFTSPNQYQIEVICDSTLREPIVTNKYTLPTFVTKRPGLAGLMWGDERSGITLELWGRHKSVILEDRETFVVNQAVAIETVVSPVATCAAYGFTCCSIDVGQGQGAQTDRVRDCPKSCFSSCLARPVVLAFTSLPFFDVKTRTATVGPNEAVTFNYIVEFGSAKAGTVTIDFGDGKTQMLTDAAGTFDHTYSCQSGSCVYQVSLVVSDVQGIQSATTSVSQVMIQVSAR